MVRNTIPHPPGSGWLLQLKQGLWVQVQYYSPNSTLLVTGSCSCPPQWVRQHWPKLLVTIYSWNHYEPDKLCLFRDSWCRPTALQDLFQGSFQAECISANSNCWQNILQVPNNLLNLSQLGSYNFWFQQSWQKLPVSVVICHGRAENLGFLPVCRPCLARWWVSHSEHWQLNTG